MAMVDDELEVLEAAGLRYSADSEPGILRRAAGRGFSYRRGDGTRVTDVATLDRIHALAIPPAWTDVWICRARTGHLQATGRDARGRKQYRYHDDWRVMRDESKFGDLVTFGAALPDIRHAVEDDLARRGLPHDKVVALVIALLDRTLIRVGNEEYRRDNGTYGLTTMLAKHIELDGATVRFHFTAKGGIRQDVHLTDRRLATAVRRCHELGGREVFTYEGDDGAVRRVDSADCNAYLQSLAGDATTVKTFRTWGGSVAALDFLVHYQDEPNPHAVLDAIDAAAERLGNTRAVARRSYVHPAVPESFLDGTLASSWRSARRSETMSRPERALLHLVESRQGSSS
jgi:DNA topoisomerase-1